METFLLGIILNWRKSCLFTLTWFLDFISITAGKETRSWLKQSECPYFGGNDAKSLSIRPKEFCLFGFFFFFWSKIYLAFFSLFMGIQSSRKSNMMEMSVLIWNKHGYFILTLDFLFLFQSQADTRGDVQVSVCISEGGGCSVDMHQLKEILVVRGFSVSPGKPRKIRVLGVSSVGKCECAHVRVSLAPWTIASCPSMGKSGFILRSCPSYTVPCEIPFSLWNYTGNRWNF